MDAGIFAHYGLKLNISFASSTVITNADVLSGHAQIGYSSTGTLIPADQAGAGLKYISNLEVSATKLTPFPGNNQSLMVAAGSTITSPAQLVGKTLGLGGLTGGGALEAAIAISTAGGDPSKVNKVVVPYADMPAEIANGTIAAAVEIAPYYTASGQQLLENLDQTVAGVADTGYVASAAYIATHLALVKAFAQAQQESILYTQANFSKITPALLARASGLPASEASSFTAPKALNFSTNLNPPGFLIFEAIREKYGFMTGPIMPIAALNYTAPGTPMTKLLFNSAGKYIGKTTITCAKGTLTKKVTAVSPRCPAGYHLKK
jgi:NitT/TauT family transport system substrate-binding protein